MKNKLNVLFITSTFPRSEEDQLAKWIGELAIRLKKKGVKISVLAPAYKGSPSHNYFGIPVHRFRYAPAFLEVLTHEEGAIMKIRENPLFIILSVFYLICGSIATIKHILNYSYDVVNVHWPFPNGIFGIIAKRIKGIRLILTFHGAEFTLAKHMPLGKTAIWYILKSSDKIIANSLHTKRKIQEIKNLPVRIIPFGSAIRLRKTVKNNENRGYKKILFVGRLIERKGVTFLISSMPDILSSVDVRLDVVGDGPLHASLKKQISDLNLQDKILLHGKVDNDKLMQFYQECDVFVLPSIVDKWGDTEGLGVVLLEAMNFKKPIVASRVGGIVDIIKDGETGLLVPEKDPQALALAIKKIFKDRNLSLRLGESGYNYAVNNFSWEKIIENTLKTYR